MARTSSARRDRQILRILGLLKTLAEGGRPSVHQLAARFKTRRETIYRDMRALEAIGYPIVGDESGRLSRPRLAAGLRSLPPLALTREELVAITWAVKTTGPRQPFRSGLTTLLPKLDSLASGKEGDFAVALDGAVTGWDRGVKDYSGAEGTIGQLVQAILSGRRCRVTHQSPWRKEPRTFLFDPYRLLSVHGGLYCIGYSRSHDEIITPAVDRILAVEVTEEPSAVDPGFDPKRYEGEAFGVAWAKPMTVVVRFTADQAPYVRERVWHPTQKIRDLKDGRIELVFRAGGEFEIARWILTWGNSAEIVRPKHLRHRIVNTLRAAVATYLDEWQSTMSRDEKRDRDSTSPRRISKRCQR